MINEAEYNALQKAKRNAEYIAMLDKSDEELKAGKVVVKTIEELETGGGTLFTGTTETLFTELMEE